MTVSIRPRQTTNQSVTTSPLTETVQTPITHSRDPLHIGHGAFITTILAVAGQGEEGRNGRRDDEVSGKLSQIETTTDPRLGQHIQQNHLQHVHGHIQTGMPQHPTGQHSTEQHARQTTHTMHSATHHITHIGRNHLKDKYKNIWETSNIEG